MIHARPALLTLAATPSNRGNVPPLPSPPALARYLLENPWPLAVTLALAAIVVFAVFNQRAELRRGLVFAGALLAAAAGVWVTGRTVITPREHLRQRTYELIGAVLRGESAGMARILEPEAVAYFPEAPDGVRILDWVAPNLTGVYRVREWAVLEEQASIDGPNVARTQFRVRVSDENHGLPYLGWVRFNWRQDPSGAWRVKSVEEVARGVIISD